PPRQARALRPRPCRRRPAPSPRPPLPWLSRAHAPPSITRPETTRSPQPTCPEHAASTATVTTRRAFARRQTILSPPAPFASKATRCPPVLTTPAGAPALACSSLQPTRTARLSARGTQRPSTSSQCASRQLG